MNNNVSSFSWPGWETVKLIGRGSFGEIYEIERKIFDSTEKAALKVISIPKNSTDIEEMHSDGYDDESITSTFKSYLKDIVAEYSLMRKMNGCANIVNCDDVRYVQHDDGIGWDIFIKMELLTPLTKALPNIITEDIVVNVAKDMCTALELCKKNDIIHRDIKPQNIFVSDNGDYKLGDFGIAKTVEKTVGGTKIGTYQYMAPEVYNNQPYNHTVDIYSLGLVLYWMLNGRRMPFIDPLSKMTADIMEKAKSRRLSGEQIPPPSCGSKEIIDIVLKACEYDPKLRYQSPQEMMHDLMLLYPEAETVSQNECTVRMFTEKDEDSHSVQSAEVQHNNIKIDELKRNVEYDNSAKMPGSSKIEQFITNNKLKVVLLALIFVIVGIVVAIIGFFTIHNWSEATCMEESACSICGKTKENALGHNWISATDTSPLTCERCHITEGLPIGVPLINCSTIDDSNNSKKTDIVLGDMLDNGGVIHADSLTFWVAKSEDYANTEYIVYQVDGQYEILSGLITLGHLNSSESAVRIYIYCDDNLAYESNYIKGKEQETFQISISGVQTIKVVCETDEPCDSYGILSAMLHKSS